MKLSKSSSKNSCTYYIIKSFRNNAGKGTSAVVERLGSLEEIKQNHNCEDPLKWAHERVKQLTQEEKEQSRTIMARLSPGKLIEKDKCQSCNCGYLFLKQIYMQLGLDKVCAALSRKHGYEYNLDQILQLLVFARVLFPSSKLATLKKKMEFLEHYNLDLHQIYRSLDILSGHSDYIQKRLFLNSKKIMNRDTTIIYYDCTNYFFETEEADPAFSIRNKKVNTGLRQYGASKEHRPNPIVQMGMFIDNTGVPIAYNINPGNTNENITLRPTERKIIEGMGVKRVVVCTDGGLASEENRYFNSIEQRSFITVQSLKKLPGYLQDQLLSPKGWKILGKDDTEYDLSDPSLVEKYYTSTFYRQRWIKNDKTGFEQRIIVTFSYKYRAYLRWLRQRQLDKASDIAQGKINPRRNPNSPEKYLSTQYATAEGELAIFRTMVVNMQAIRDEESFDGFYAICTDLKLPVSEIIRLNHNRWESEDAFRVLKTDFQARPVYLQTEAHIRAHFLTCFLALTIFRILENRLNHNFTSHQILQTLKDMSLNIIKAEGYKPDYMRTDLTDALHEMAGFRTDTEIVTNKAFKQIMKIIKG